MGLSEAEIQVLASLRGAQLEEEPADRASVERWGQRYWIFREDWTVAFAGLAQKGLIGGDDSGYRLTDLGHPLAERYHRERPDMYWYYYQCFYPAASASATHSRFCEQVFGADLCQEGQTDMAELDRLLGLLELQPGEHLLDLGCGAGGLSEYMSDQAGVMVTGLDYSPSAIAAARERTRDKRARLNFLEGDLNTLELPSQAFDAAILIDSIYWVADIDASLRSILQTLRPGGRLVIAVVQTPADVARPADLEIDQIPVARALARLGLDYEARDQTEAFAGFWPRVRETALALREPFAAERNAFICDNWVREAEEEYLPALEAGQIRRYHYRIGL